MNLWKSFFVDRANLSLFNEINIKLNRSNEKANLLDEKFRTLALLLCLRSPFALKFTRLNSLSTYITAALAVKSNFYNPSARQQRFQSVTKLCD